MDAAYNSALSALADSAIGAMASFATTWLTQHSQERATLLMQDRARREVFFGEFIRKEATLFGDASRHNLDDPAKLVNLYAIVNKIRLFGSRIISHRSALPFRRSTRPTSAKLGQQRRRRRNFRAAERVVRRWQQCPGWALQHEHET